MMVDVAVLVALLVFVAVSYRRGLLRKLASIAALLIACFASGFVAREAAAYAISRWGYNPALTYGICVVLAWLVLFYFSRFIFRRLAKKLGSGEEGKPKPWNRKLGALFGALEALALAWLVVGMLDAIPEDVRARRLPGLHDQLEGSLFTSWVVRTTSPAALLELQPLISDLAVVSDDPKALRAVQTSRKLRALVTHPKVAAIIEDEELLEEWRRGRLARFFADRKVREALEDPEVRKLIRELPVAEILRQAAESAR